MNVGETNTVYLKAHSRTWKWKFRKEKVLLRVFFGRQILDIEHVGSTAIPGMVAKPIIDIVATVPDFERAYEYVDKIKQLGYEYKGENKELRQYFFTKGTTARYHLYIQEKYADIWGRIAFRDCLIRNSELARRYAELKRILAFQNAEDLRSYWEGKREFIDQVVLTASEC